MGVVFSSFSYFWVSLGGSGTGLEKHAEKVRNQTFQNLENGVPVYTGAQFSFSPRHPEMVQFYFICGFIVGSLAVFYGDFRCFFVRVFPGPDLWVHSEIGRSPSRGLGSPGEGLREGKPLPQRGLRAVGY